MIGRPLAHQIQELLENKILFKTFDMSPSSLQNAPATRCDRPPLSSPQTSGAPINVPPMQPLDRLQSQECWSSFNSLPAGKDGDLSFSINYGLVMHVFLY
jgi:hypothetical protein